MSDEEDIESAILGIMKDDSRYSAQSYDFVMAVIIGMQEDLHERRHLTGQEILEGLRRSASRRFGPMAKEVFNLWGVYTTSDFGNIVYNLIEAGLLVKTSEDDIRDFRDGYDFRTVFEEDYFKN